MLARAGIILSQRLCMYGKKKKGPATIGMSPRCPMHRCCSVFWVVLLLYACSTDTPPPEETRPIAQDPEGVRLVNRGAFFLKQGQPRKALTVLHQAAKRVPNLPSVHFNTGLAHVRLGEYGLAISPLQRAVELDSLNGSFRFVLGDALSAEHRYPEAILQYQCAIELEPAKALYRYQLGKSLRATADFAGGHCRLCSSPGFGA